MAETLKKWEEISRSYRVYIKLEKRLSENTVESYMRDLRQFAHFILRFYDVPPRKVEAPMIERYLALLYDQGRDKSFSKDSLFSAFSIASQSVPMIVTPLDSRGSARFTAVCPPSEAITPSGRSSSITFITSSTQRGSKYSLSEVV